MRLLKGCLVCLGSLSILFFSFVCFAADDDILSFIPAFVKAQTIPTGTWSGAGQGSWDSCTCSLSGITFTVTSGSRNTYFVEIQTSGATCDSGCGVVFNFTNVPAVLIGDRFVFRHSFTSTVGSRDLMTDLYGELVISGTSAKYFLSTSNFVVPFALSSGAATSMLGGTLTKQ